MAVDAIDARILAALQEDGGLSNVELAERVGLSPSPCLRRVKMLEDAGVIEGYRWALLGTAKADGPVELSVTATDKAGNASTSRFAYVRDTVAPELTATSRIAIIRASPST